MTLPKRNKPDQVPYRPIARAAGQWLREHGHQTKSDLFSMGFASDRPRASFVLAERTGVSEDYITKMSLGANGNERWKWMAFDVADKILAATDNSDLWYRDEELHMYYTGGVVEAADRACRKKSCERPNSRSFETLEEAKAHPYALRHPPFHCACGAYHLAPGLGPKPKYPSEDEERRLRRLASYQRYYRKKKAERDALKKAA